MNASVAEQEMMEQTICHEQRPSVDASVRYIVKHFSHWPLLEGEGTFFKTHIQPVPCLCTLLDLIVTSSLMPRGNSIGTCKTHERCLSCRLQLTRIDSGGTLSFFLI